MLRLKTLRIQRSDFAVTKLRSAPREFGFPPFPTLAAENNDPICDRVVNCRRPWLHLGKGQ
jgi:hypothetical protein